MIPLILLFALFLPFLLWPIEQFFPYPYIVEEFSKMLLILVVISEGENKRDWIKTSIVLGALFAFTEGVFFLLNIALVGNVNTFIYRLLITVPFHAISSFLIVLPALYKKKLIIVGFLAASVFHYIFNILIANLSNFPS
jgi:hypothetical protein